MRHWAEDEAKAYLLAQGYRILAENYTVRGAELDLVAQLGELTVIVEVKQRRSERFGSPAELISAQKLARLRLAALSFVASYFGRDDALLRFDAVLLLGSRTEHTLTHLEGIG